MVVIIPSKEFIKNTKRLNAFERLKLEKQVKKIIKNPEVGKPLHYKRGERSLYIKPFRLIYAVNGENIFLLKFDHRKRVYD
tara:strand:+ start:4004 stop:4246 length:243 start_codon:yes stop_codon:yes gene_type:complete